MIILVIRTCHNIRGRGAPYITKKMLERLIHQQERLVWSSQISLVKVAFFLNRYLPYAASFVEVYREQSRIKCIGDIH